MSGGMTGGGSGSTGAGTGGSVSRFKWMTAAPKKDWKWTNAKVGDFRIEANASYFAIPWSTPNANTLAVMPFEPSEVAPRRFADSPALLVNNATILGFDLHPFVHTVAATAARDGAVKLWQFPEDGIRRNIEEPTLTLSGHTKRAAIAQFHPTANHVLASAAADSTVRLWDLEAGKEMSSFAGHDDVALSVSFSLDGQRFVTSCKDKKLRYFDARKPGEATSSTDAHDGLKGFHTVWLGESERVATVGFNKASLREVAVWDNRKLSQPLKRHQMNMSPSMLVPFYDLGTDLIYLVDKGEGMHVFEASDTSPHLQFVLELKFAAILNAKLLPKRLCDVSKCEVAQFLKLNKDMIEFVSMQVPRKTSYFQEDLFPPTPSGEPSISSAEFFAGKLAPPKLVSLKPEGAVSVFDVPEEAGGKKRAEDVAAAAAAAASSAAAGIDASAPHQPLSAALEGQLAELTSSFFRKFRQVHLSLKDEVLYAFDSAEASTSIYTIPIKPGLRVVHPDKDMWEQVQDVCFQVTDGRDLDRHYRATTTKEATHWVNTIRLALQKASPAAAPQQTTLSPSSLTRAPSAANAKRTSTNGPPTAAGAPTSPASQKAAEAGPDMTGKLVKVGTLFVQTGFFRSWKPRHVKLVRQGASGSKLLYFENETSKDPLGTVDTGRLTWVSVKDLEDLQAAQHIRQKIGTIPRLLELTGLGRTFIFQAASDNEANEWVRAIHACINFAFQAIEPKRLRSGPAQQNGEDEPDYNVCGANDPKCNHITRGDLVTLKEAGMMFDSWPQRWVRVDNGVLKLYPYVPEKDQLENMLEDIHMSKVLYVRRTVNSQLSLPNTASSQHQQQHAHSAQQEQELIAADPAVLTEFQVITATRVCFLRASSVTKAITWVTELEYIRSTLQQAPVLTRSGSSAINLFAVATVLDPDATSAPEDGETDPDSHSSSGSITPVPVNATTTLEGYVDRPQGMLGLYSQSWMSLVGQDLFFFRYRGATQPDKRVPMTSVQSVVESEKDPELGFQIKTATATLDLRAKTPEERDRWCAVIMCMLQVDVARSVAKALHVPEVETEDSPEVTAAVVLDRSDVHNGKKVLLIRCTAKRRGYAHLCEAKASSLNSACSYVLDTGKKIYQWNGTAASRLTKAKGWDVAMRIHKHERDGVATIITMEQGARDEKKEFFDLLDGKPESYPTTFDESLIVASPVKIYKVVDHKEFAKRVVVVFEGRKPSKDILKTNFAYVVESEAEIYVWQGKSSSQTQRKLALRIAKTLYVQPERPSWKILFKVLEGQEMVLFKEKFDGFPGLFQGTSMMAEAKGNIAQTAVQQTIDPLVLYNSTPRRSKEDELFENDPKPEGRFKIWRISDFEMEPFPRGLYGQLFGGDSYVIQYTYFFKNSDRHVIYYWQGKDSSVTEKGASALWTIELDDKELGGEATQLRTTMNKECHHFLAMFKGKMLVRMGSFATFGSAGSVLMFDVRGNDAIDTRGVETVSSVAHLHSWHSAVVSGRLGTFTWHGRHSNDHEHRTAARLAAQFKLESQEIISIEEGEEPPEFWEMLGAKQPYFDGYGGKERVSPRLYSFTNATGVVTAEQVFNFCQEDLEDELVFVLDALHEVYVWFGTRSKPIVRKYAMETAQAYVANAGTKHPKGKNTPLWVINSGKESINFLAHFHGWARELLERPAEPAAASSSRSPRKGSIDKKGGHVIRSVQEVLVEYTLEIYTYEELLQEVLPPGVDSRKLETYLSEHEFKKLFGMTKREYEAVPPWKKDNLKKAANLY
ncbi:hypothetical protein CAOG_05747 [Capsaspora owczarzaki ATCC 30864]|uniref:HP domain-containing protein n=1 Tax=Capsaspora owczarzaki (strain ATCC 30864) TaxID=595528 RepID=A0A0D2WSP5_CAPO3|nr:hypothetical protein CAOG_05747 [Capsaspora owczarzaki ATCC 30864]KJE95275.1 hypothetical protein CAOG_005747 [Capsaspora owczarzaki ATCC 30864]|eukprot:XP_004346420.2 hypothetical protein CAOG_05747 [Capsaspora owczarzaki ATCC 30864]